MACTPGGTPNRERKVCGNTLDHDPCRTREYSAMKELASTTVRGNTPAARKTASMMRRICMSCDSRQSGTPATARQLTERTLLQGPPSAVRNT